MACPHRRLPGQGKTYCGSGPATGHEPVLRDGLGRTDWHGMITVIAHYRTTPEAAEDVKRLLAQHARMSEAEPGCQCFLVHQGADDAARFALYEVYDDLEAFEAHRNSDHFRVNIEQTLVPLLLEREWRMYGPAI